MAIFSGPFGKLQATSAIAGILDGVLQFQQNRRARQAGEADRQLKLRELKQQGDDLSLRRRLAAEAERRRQMESDRSFDLNRDRFSETQRVNQGNEQFRGDKLNFDMGQPGVLEQIRARGEEARQTKSVPGSASQTDPFVEDTKRRGNVGRQVKSIRDIGKVAGFSSSELDQRHPGLIEDAVEDASRTDNSLTTDEAVLNGVAFDYAKSLTDPDDTFFDGDIGPDLLELGVTAGDVPVGSGAHLNGLLGDGTFDDDQPVDLEDIAKVFAQDGKSEKEYKEFIYKLVVEPNLNQLTPDDRIGALKGAAGKIAPFLPVTHSPLAVGGRLLFNKIQDRRNQGQ